VTVPVPFSVRQSDLSNWQKCPLKYKYQYIDHLPREQSGSLTFGSILHELVLLMETEQDVEAAVAKFHEMWLDPEKFDPGWRIQYYVRGTNWRKYQTEGERMLRDWWGIIRWDADVTLAREFMFDVPIGDGHILHGTIDKLVLRYDAKTGKRFVLVSDYKTSKKTPTYDWLEDNLQFSAYLYATTQDEFWANMPNGEYIRDQVRDLPRRGEWVALNGPKRLNAGDRTDVHYERLTMMVNALAESVAMRIFVPTISGESCRYCEFRQNCGLRVIQDDE